MDSVLWESVFNCEANKYSLIMQTRMILHILLVAKFVTIDDLNQFLNHALAAGWYDDQKKRDLTCNITSLSPSSIIAGCLSLITVLRDSVTESAMFVPTPSPSSTTEDWDAACATWECADPVQHLISHLSPGSASHAVLTIGEKWQSCPSVFSASLSVYDPLSSVPALHRSVQYEHSHSRHSQDLQYVKFVSQEN